MKTILLLGATGGIGAEVVKLLQHSYIVITPTKQELNLTDMTSVTCYDYSKFDIIINCAGVNVGTYLGFEDNSVSNQFEQVMVNYFAPTQIIKQYVKNRTTGTFCYISSISLYEPGVYNIYNAASKMALVYSVDTLRKEYKNFNFIEICPGKTKTNILYNNYNGSKTKRQVEHEYSSTNYLTAYKVAKTLVYALEKNIDKIIIKPEQ